MIAGHLQEKYGFFYIVLSYRDENGKRHTPWFPTKLPVKGNKKRAEALLLEQLCAGAQRFFDGSDAYPGRDQLDEAQFHRFFVRLYPELKRQMPHAVCKEFSD